MLGLYSRYKDEISAFGGFATITGIIGGAISFLVTLTWSLQISFTEGEADWWLFITGISFYFLALVLFGVACLREQMLPRWNALPIIAGSWLLVVWLSSIFSLGDGMLSDPIMLGLT